MGDFRKKNNLQTDFEGKKFLQGNTRRKKKSYTEKKSFTPYNPEKYYYIVVCQKKILSPEIRGQKILFPKPNNSYHPEKSNGRPLIFGGRCNRYF